jgi:hypothetical protein
MSSRLILQTLRIILTSLLILLGSLLTFPASLAVWEQRVLMDEERFVAVGRDVLEQDAVQSALAQRIAAEVIGSTLLDPDVPPEASRLVAAGIVRQLPESPIGDEALRRSHALLVRLVRDERLTAQEDSIVLDLRPVVERVLEGLDIAGQGGTGGIELPEGAGQVTLVHEADLTLAFRMARLFDTTAWYIAALPLVVFALAVIVSPARLMTLALIGLVVALLAGLRIFLIGGPVESLLIDAA